MRLLDPVDGSYKTIVVVPGVGTFKVDPNSGAVTFIALPGYDGTAAVTYRVSDTTGQLTSSKVSVRIPAQATPVSIRTTPSAKTVKAGSIISYTIRATVKGPARAVNLKICQSLPASLVYVATPGATLSHGKPCWKVASAKAGTVLTYKVRVRVVAGTSAGSLAAPATVVADNARRQAARAMIKVLGQRVAGGSGGVTG